MKNLKKLFVVSVLLLNVVVLFAFMNSNKNIIQAMEYSENLDNQDLLSVDEITEDDFELVDNIKNVSRFSYLFNSEDSLPIGYVEFESGQKVSVSTKTDHKTLLKNAGFMNPGILLKEGDEPTNTAIAGHYMDNGMLFGSLKDIELGEIVSLNTDKTKYVYKIYETRVVEDTEVEMIEDSAADGKDIISLMTCTNNGKQRLFVIGELVDVIYN